MYLGRVIGTVWATKKQETLEGLKLLVVRPLSLQTSEDAQPIVAVDVIGAGVGELVLVVVGRAARFTIGRGQEIACQTAVVGIVDQLALEGGRIIEA
jgi:ethanolamine utilization protein EutN